LAGGGIVIGALVLDQMARLRRAQAPTP